jgi:hypothetical protein
MPSVVILSVYSERCYAVSRHSRCCSGECLHDKCLKSGHCYAECHNAECHHNECRGAIKTDSDFPPLAVFLKGCLNFFGELLSRVKFPFQIRVPIHKTSKNGFL